MVIEGAISLVYLFSFLFVYGSTLGAAAHTEGDTGRSGVEAGDALGRDMVFYQQEQEQEQQQSRAEQRNHVTYVC